MTRTLPRHIFKRGDNYAVRFTVPVEVRTVVGKKEIVRSLGTKDLGEALAKRNSVLEEIKTSLFAEIDEPVAKGGATKFNKKATRSATVRDTAHQWLSESDGINGSTRNRYRSILEAFEDYSGNTDVTKINREMALSFIDHLRTTPSAKTGHLLAHRTLQAYQICLSSYWRVLDHKGLVDPNMRNPFSSLLRRLAGQKKRIDPRKKNLRPVTRAEAEDLLTYITSNDALKYKHEMYVTVRLLWVTACRLNEIVGLMLTEIDDCGDYMALRITNAKTEAGNRTVMIVGEDDCDVLREAVRSANVAKPRMVGNKGHLFPRLLRGGYDRKLSHYLGKALERARKTFPTSNEWDMHSFRRAGVSALVNAGVSRGERNLIVGHSNRDDIGMAVYARRGDLTEVIKATFKVLLKELGGSLNAFGSGAWQRDGDS